MDHEYISAIGGSWEALNEHHRICAEINTNGGFFRIEKNELTICELTRQFMNFTQAYYALEESNSTPQTSLLREALQPLNSIYGESLVKVFGPLALTAVRQKMVEMA